MNEHLLHPVLPSSMMKTDDSETDFPIDEEIIPLLDVLEELPGVYVTFGCSGHEEADIHPGQVPAGQFFVDFQLDPDDDASMASLGLLTAVCQGMSEGEGEQVAYIVTIYDAGLSFELRGIDIDIGHIAQAIEEELESCYEDDDGCPPAPVDPMTLN